MILLYNTPISLAGHLCLTHSLIYYISSYTIQFICLISQLILLYFLSFYQLHIDNIPSLYNLLFI